jgi:nicotinamidase-related amidase
VLGVVAEGVVITQECQKGVLGTESLRPALYEHGRATGKLDNMGRGVASARAAGCVVIHAIAAHRSDLRDSNTNARIFTSIARDGLFQQIGTPLVEVIDEISTAPHDIVSTRLHGGSPIAGTDVDALLRNLKISTVVIIGNVNRST